MYIYFFLGGGWGRGGGRIAVWLRRLLLDQEVFASEDQEMGYRETGSGQCKT